MKTGLQGAIESLRQAMITANRDELGKWTADQLVYGHASGRMESKREFIESMTKHPWSQIAFSDQKITYVDNFAIVHQAVVRGRASDSERVNELAVWRSANEQWTLVARQTVGIEKP